MEKLLSEDKELAEDVVKLLAQQLRQVRSQLSDCKQELSSRVSAENEELSTMHKLNSKLENEIISLRERLDELCQRELKPRLTEGKIIQTEHGEEAQATSKNYKTKYKDMKEKRGILQTELNTVASNLAELKSSIALPKTTIPMDDWSVFLNSDVSHKDPTWPGYRDISECWTSVTNMRSSSGKFPCNWNASRRTISISDGAVPSVFRSTPTVIIQSWQIVWPHDGMEQALVLESTHHSLDQMQSFKGGRERASLYADFGNANLIVTWKNDHCKYLGTYELKWCKTCAVAELKEHVSLDHQGETALIEGLTNHLVVSSAHIPPLMLSMFRQFFRSGLFKVKCYALQRIGFENQLYAEFNEISKKQPSKQPSKQPLPSKRRIDHSEYDGNPSKRSKKL